MEAEVIEGIVADVGEASSEPDPRNAGLIHAGCAFGFIRSICNIQCWAESEGRWVMTGEADYQYRVDECDVRDRDRLVAYRQKRREWLNLLEVDEHSVFGQLHAMMWRSAVFNVINESRRGANQRKEEVAALNGTLAEFIDHGFVALQTLAIRRLLEPPARNERRQIVSLRRVLSDVHANRELITRENYVSHDALPYDYEPAKQAHYEEHMRKRAEGYKGVFTSSSPANGPKGFLMSERMHAAFDGMSAVRPEERARDDLIRGELFEALDRILDESGHDDFKVFADKIIAHAGDEYSRALVEDAKTRITLENFSACQRAICQVTNFLAADIVSGSHSGGFPIPQFDPLEHLDKSWCSPEGLREMNEEWQRRVAEIEAWPALKADDLLAMGHGDAAAALPV